MTEPAVYAASWSFNDLMGTLDAALVIAFLGSLVFAAFKGYKGDLGKSGKIALVITMLSFVAYLVKNPDKLAAVATALWDLLPF